jgi:hypothetical protein
MNKYFFDRHTVHIIGLSWLSFIEALQVLIMVALIFSFIPIPVPEFVKKLFPLSLYDVRLGRESSFYHVWIASALGLQGLLMFINRRRMGEGLPRSVLAYMWTMTGIVYIQIFAVFKIFLWNDPWWARALLYASLGLGIMMRIFWPEFYRFMSGLWGRMTNRTIPRWGYVLLDAGAIVTLLILIFTPDLSCVLARMFSYDKFYHLDSFIMSPGWAQHNGLILNRDVTSEYSLMIPVVFDGLMKICGGFSYAHAVSLMIGLSAVYYFLLYGLWRYWLGSFALAFFAVILSVKLQFFHWGVVPLIWIYPSATPLRFLPDVFFLFCILRFTQSLRRYWLLAAAVACGLALAWTIDVGTYMYATLWMAGLALIYQKGIRSLPSAVLLCLTPLLIAWGVLSIFYGALVWQGSFWNRSFEFASFFLQGWGALPITEGLKDKQFFALCMGLMIPVFYLGTFLFSLGTFLFRRSGRYLFMVLVCVYGLGLYHYYIHRSAVTSYYAVAVPMIFVLMFWIKTLLGCCQESWQRALKIFLCAWALVGLTTGYLFTYYPNSLNLSGYDWNAEKKFYTEQFDFSQDASLIDALTTPQEAVPLISSFETKILMQAQRRPFFYYFPMMESEHMQGDKLRNFYLHTYASLQGTLQQLTDRKPLHVFIQARLFEGTQAQSYADSHGGFKQLMAYLRQHYQYEARGQYLTALKLKGVH